LSVLTYTYLYSLLLFYPFLLSFLTQSSDPLIHSILVGTWIRLFMFNQ
jgi:hypothetical protein